MKRIIGRSLLIFTVPSILGLAVLLSGIWIRSHDPLRARNKSHLVDAMSGEVKSFTIEGPLKGFPLVVERNTDGWSLCIDGKTPYPANEAYVDGFISELVKRRTLISASGIGEYRYGTDGDGSCMVTVRTERGNVTMFFGNSNTDERYRYVKLAGETVYRTDNGLGPWLDNRTARWVDLYPFRKRLADTSVQSVTVYGNGRYRDESDVDVMKAIEYSLANFACRDISNIPPSPELYLRVECGDAGVIQLSFTKLDGGTVLLHEMESGRSWVTGYAAFEALLRPLSDR